LLLGDTVPFALNEQNAFGNAEFPDLLGCQPFFHPCSPGDLPAVTNKAYQEQKATSLSENGLFDFWLPGTDSNREPSG
jgi:hypothetical protein